MNNSMAILGLVGSGSGYGYDVKHRYDSYFGSQKPLAFGQIYSTFARMIRDGYIVFSGQEAGGGPDRKKYEITASGLTKLEDWMAVPDAATEMLQSNLFAKTVIALLLDKNADQLLDAQRAMHIAQMRYLTRKKRTASLFDVLLYNHAMFRIEADLRWIDATSMRIKDIKKELAV